MSIINIKYGSSASSEVMNNNFQYLYDMINSLELNDDIESSIEELENSINSVKQTQQKVIAYVVATYSYGTSWYRLWSDGFCEQGGLCTNFGSDSRYCSVTFIRSYKNTNYTIVATGFATYMSNDRSTWVYSRTRSGATFANAQKDVPALWMAKGYVP